MARYANFVFRNWQVNCSSSGELEPFYCLLIRYDGIRRLRLRLQRIQKNVVFLHPFTLICECASVPSKPLKSPPKTPQNDFGTEVNHFGTEVKLTSVPKFKPANPHKMGLF